MKMFYKLRSFLIKLLSGEDITVIINTTINPKDGFIIDKNYILMNNLEINDFKQCFTIKDKSNTYMDCTNTKAF